jgi:hypothetical protein
MENETKTKKGSKVGLVISWLVIGLALGWGASMLKGDMVKNPAQNTTNQMSEEQQNKILADVGKLVILPKGEVPAIFVISDAKALSKEQPFYKDAQNDDVILVYQQTQKAIVYSPSRNVIVNVGPIILQDNAGQTTTETKATTTKK